MSGIEKILRILSIENLDEDSHPVLIELQKLPYTLVLKKVTTLSELKSQLKMQSWDFVLSNLNYFGFSVMDAIEVVRSYRCDIPFILVSEKIGEEVVADLMKSGVEDVVMKSRLERLVPVVKRILRESEIKEKEAKAEKMANVALAAKEQMLAIVSHDIKNPLSAIKLEAQMLLRATGRAEKSIFSEEVKIQANRILKTTDRLKNLISDLLDKNKSENGLTQITKDKTDVIRLLQEVLDSTRPLLQEKEISLKTTLPSEVSILLDRNKISQVFSNLLNNAINFTPVKGKIHILLEEKEHDYIFSIEDSGPGLTDVELHNVFEKYWTGSTPAGGTGLGLFICKTIIEAHDGHIFVENISDKPGARFRFSVPKLDPVLNRLPFSNKRVDSRKKIYVIDDDEDLREVIGWALGKEGHAIHSFHSPKEALDCLMLGQNLPHLIMVDFHMDEMKGSDFLLRKDNIPGARSCPVIMISASPKEVEAQVRRELYKEVVTKPIDLEGLVSNVNKLL